jgi:hypothetical protein
MDETSLVPADSSTPENVKPTGDLVPETPPPELPSFDNLCDDEEILKKFRDLARTKYDQFAADRADYDDPDTGVWAKADYMYRCGRNDSKRKSSQLDDTNADTGSTLFFRQCRALASYIVAIFLSRKRQFQHIPRNIDGAFANAQEASLQAEFHDALVQYSMSKDDMKKKMFELANLLVRYGNVPLMIHWNYRTATRKVRTPIRSGPEGEIVGYQFEEKKYVVNNEPTLDILPIECVYADRHIGNFQNQQAIIIKTADELANLYALEADGQIKNVEKITASQLAQGNENNMHQAKQENEGIDAGDDSQTGLFTRYDPWLKVPIGKNKDGKYEWNAAKYAPKWYWGLFTGSLDRGPCHLIRETYDRDGEFPGLMVNLFPDDPDMLYHFGPAQAIEPIYDELTTRKNQAIDNITLQNRRPLKAIRGEVFSKDLTYSQNKVISVEKADSLTEMQVASQLGDTMSMVQYLETEANQALGTDKPFMGEALGSRTSATEANNVYTRTMQPASMLANFVFLQLVWYVKKIDGLWELNALKDQELTITGMDRPANIKPAELFGTFDIELVVLDEFINDQIAMQNMNFLIQAAPSIPGWAQDVDTKKFNKRLLELYKVDINPGGMMQNRTSIDAERVAYHENQKLVFGATWDEPQIGEDHVAHNKQHKPFRSAFNGLEDNYPPRFFDLLDRHIAIHDEMLAQTQPPVQAPMQGPSGNVTPGQVSGNALAGQMGAMAQMGQGM